MGSRTRHSSGWKAASSALQAGPTAKPAPDWKDAVSTLRDELSVIHAAAAVVQRSLTADDGDKPAATTLLESVCYRLADIVDRLDELFIAPRP